MEYLCTSGGTSSRLDTLVATVHRLQIPFHRRNPMLSNIGRSPAQRQLHCVSLPSCCLRQHPRRIKTFGSHKDSRFQSVIDLHGRGGSRCGFLRPKIRTARRRSSWHRTRATKSITTATTELSFLCPLWMFVSTTTKMLVGIGFNIQLSRNMQISFHEFAAQRLRQSSWTRPFVSRFP